jgi:photosystem II stability/assembly factor-like uncharacterized protein
MQLRLVLWAALAAGGAASAQPRVFDALRWRSIGPFRGGRTVGAAGIPSEPNVFYVAANNGGVWKTTDAGRTWQPLFDAQPTQSIGALAIAPSNPRIIYVGSGEGLQRPDLSVGDGIYKSEDGGTTWRHLGLRNGQQIAALLVDPHNPQRDFAAVLGHPYGPNPERGVFRSLDGGLHWRKVLYRDENTGAVDLAFDPRNPRTVYAVLWAARQGPWENGHFEGQGSGLFRSTDGGDTWTQLHGGLPTPADGLGRIGIGIAPSDSNRIYALVQAHNGGLFRSGDAGATWRRVNTERRVWGRGDDFACVRVDPRDENKLYVANTSTYRSTDGGVTFEAFKGAPGGDDYHNIWINPIDPRVILLASDQGATISVNGGRTWSSWYNQPTAQFYHVSTDNRFPYRICGGQQESGSACVLSRGNDGQITFRDWHPVGAEEYGYVAPDPLHPGIFFGGKASRYDETTGMTQDVGPDPPGNTRYRFLRTEPLLFSPTDPHTLYLAGNVLFRTTDGGHSWSVISPDLSREKWDIPPSVGVFRSQAEGHDQRRRGVIYTVAPSPLDGNLIWAGTDDGLIHLTRDGGKSWTNVTPPAITAWSKVSLIEASPFDASAAYAAINRIRLDDLRPHIYRTRDFGATWTEIVNGLPENEPVNAVREDPRERGLLFAATERGVYVSFNSGDFWQPLRFNLPATSVRDIVIHGDDLVAATHGRGFWILDDITPLRQSAPAEAAAAAYLYEPATAIRVRRDQNTDTPLPPEEPAAQNPPDGAVIDFWLKDAPRGPVTLEFVSNGGAVLRRFSSTDLIRPTPEELAKQMTVPLFWARIPKPLPGQTGMHRFVWDLHQAPPDSIDHDFPISAIPGDTPRAPEGPLVVPGRYTVRLTVNGVRYERPLTIQMDPRVKTSASALESEFALASRLSRLITADTAAWRAARARGDAKQEQQLAGWNADLTALLAIVDGADAEPTTQAVAAANKLESSLRAAGVALR